jgi:hypothetical protein
MCNRCTRYEGSLHLKTCTVGHGIRFQTPHVLHPYRAINVMASGRAKLKKRGLELY